MPGQVSVTATDPGERQAELAGRRVVLSRGRESSRPGSELCTRLWLGRLHPTWSSSVECRMSSSGDCRPIANIPAVRFGRRLRESRCPHGTKRKDRTSHSDRAQVRLGEGVWLVPRGGHALPDLAYAQSCASGSWTCRNQPAQTHRLFCATQEPSVWAAF